MLRGPQPAGRALQALQSPQSFRRGEHVKGQLAEAVNIIIERAKTSTISLRTRSHT